MRGGLAWVIAAVTAQATTPQFPSRVELVTLDVVVVDTKGRPVTDLTVGEFRVEEDGLAQEIVSFERSGADAAAAESEPAARPVPATGAAAGSTRNGAAFAVVVDDQGLGVREASDTRAALVRFVSGAVRDGDTVLLATTSGDAWWSAVLPEGREDVLAIVARIRGREPEVSRATDFMSDYEAFAIHERNDTTTAARVVERWTASGACMVVQGRPDLSCPSRVRASAASFNGARTGRTQRLLATLRRTVDALAWSPGRKSVLLYSRGFLQDSAGSVRDVMAAAREANAAVYFIDTRGLQTRPGLPGAADAGAPNPADSGRIGFEAGVLESEGAQALADDTGGLSFRNTNDLDAPATRVASESRAYYLLGFHPRPDRKAADWRKLEVEVTRPGVTVRTRKGYRLQPSGAKREAKSGIPLRTMAFVFEPRDRKLTRVLIAAEFDAGGLPFEGSGGARAARVGVAISVTHRDTGRTLESSEEVGVRAGDGGEPGWRSMAREFELPAGVSQVRVVVRDRRRGATGAAYHRFDVPDAGEMRMTTPIVTDRVEHGSAGDHPRAAITARRVFPPGGALYCEFEVLGAKIDPTLHAPRVVAGFEVRAADGRLVRKGEPTPIAPGPGVRLVRLIGIGVDGWAEGDYRLVLTVSDGVSGTRVERAEPFTLRLHPE